MRMWIRMQPVMFMFNFLNVNAASRVSMHFKLLPPVGSSSCPAVRFASVDLPSKFAMLLATHNFPCTLSGQDKLISILVCFLRHHRLFSIFPASVAGSYDLWFVDFSHSTLHRFPPNFPSFGNIIITVALPSSKFQSFSWQLALPGHHSVFILTLMASCHIG